jgi:hypothetical protein
MPARVSGHTDARGQSTPGASRAILIRAAENRTIGLGSRLFGRAGLRSRGVLGRERRNPRAAGRGRARGCLLRPRRLRLRKQPSRPSARDHARAAPNRAALHL